MMLAQLEKISKLIGDNIDKFPFSIDYENKIIKLNPGWKIESDDDIIIKSKKHIMIESGCDPDPEKEGMIHSIWLNTEVDEKGKPVTKDID